MKYWWEHIYTKCRHHLLVTQRLGDSHWQIIFLLDKLKINSQPIELLYVIFNQWNPEN